MRTRLNGIWKGIKQLFLMLKEEPGYVSDSLLSIEPATNGLFFQFSCTWDAENTDHDSQVLLGHNEQQDITAMAWPDSCQQGRSPMYLEGHVNERGTFDILGSYLEPPGSDRGWRMTIEATADQQLSITMQHIYAEGQDEIAVRPRYDNFNKDH